MKVGTDSILLGSWVNPLHAQHILDVGTGSGLLAVMMAQKSADDAQILGIDIDDAAISQARDNGQASPWPQKLDFRCTPLQALGTHQQYELIISNPPYFPPGQTFDPQRQQARHTGELSHQELIEIVCQLLSSDGRFAFVLPTTPGLELVDMAKAHGLYVQRQLWIKTREDKMPVRILVEMGYEHAPQPEMQLLSIYDLDNTYTDQYKSLCRDYYLNF
ncbi:tRNA1(Val) (adenine(37)-N6)-methyltransferase [Bowmanella yangjiangensis]|uniref:tRNA1(Val) (adenine(37)-N6)-methyltransferase n=1 Tax=Bowmanella yangjiangensis TaxID=2811230 RepID=A0ABS3CQY9_9ALTE|nr:methyltransferase [Bowmanella yangjiangensis]MBN7819532.1 methyltransferase [Bowmanella yangjiangensis]